MRRSVLWIAAAAILSLMLMIAGLLALERMVTAPQEQVDGW